MTPEHRVQQEYVVRAADQAGLPAATEVVLPNRAKPDVVVNADTALEMQRSGISPAKIKARTTRAYRGGMSTTTWVSDKEKAPAWMGIVPAVRVFARDWMHLPAPGEAKVVGGLVQLQMMRCVPANTVNCPETHRRPCGRWHIAREPLRGVTLDEVTVGLALGEYMPVQVRKSIFVAKRSEAEHVGARLWTPPPSNAKRLHAADRVECQADRPAAAPSVATHAAVSMPAPADPFAILAQQQRDPASIHYLGSAVR